MDLVIRLLFLCIVIYFREVNCMEVTTVLPKNLELVLNNTRRILKGREITDSRPYMVYLKLPKSDKKHDNQRSWLCGGVIVHEEYILTSAACVQDAEHFYVVSGTYRHSDADDSANKDCIENGRKKAIWKCVPKEYVFDGYETNNIRWLHNDIAVVRVEDPFSFEHKVKGCDFVPKAIAYNNHSKELEDKGTKGSVAGWGSTAVYQDAALTHRNNEETSLNSERLQEADVEVIDKEVCKKHWGERYAAAIEKYMICTKDASHGGLCEEHANCVDIEFDTASEGRRREGEDLGASALSGRRNIGGFCENDHGGPLVHGYGNNAVVIGVIAASLVREKTNECYGPFLYTSVYNNRQFIDCAIYKETEKTCLLRIRPNVIESTINWDRHPDGPARSELKSNVQVKLVGLDVQKVKASPEVAPETKSSESPENQTTKIE